MDPGCLSPALYRYCEWDHRSGLHWWVRCSIYCLPWTLQGHITIYTTCLDSAGVSAKGLILSVFKMCCLWTNIWYIQKYTRKNKHKAISQTYLEFWSASCMLCYLSPSLLLSRIHWFRTLQLSFSLASVFYLRCMHPEKTCCSVFLEYEFCRNYIIYNPRVCFHSAVSTLLCTAVPFIFPCCLVLLSAWVSCDSPLSSQGQHSTRWWGVSSLPFSKFVHNLTHFS